MGQTIIEIENIIDGAKAADPILSGLTSTSDVADWNLWKYIVSFVQNILGGLFDKLKTEISAIVAAQKPHTLKWYATKAKAFQLGDPLDGDTDVYNPINAAHCIVANAAAVELVGLVRIKTAKLVGGVLAPLTSGELTSFTAYMARVKDAGVRLDCISRAADDFRLHLSVFYDPLIIDNTGARIDGTSPTPVQDAITSFLDNLPFNGLFVLNYLIIALQGIEGVRIGEVIYCAARQGAFPYANIAYEYVPDAGYMVLDAADFIANTTYTAHTAIN